MAYILRSTNVNIRNTTTIGQFNAVFKSSPVGGLVKLLSYVGLTDGFIKLDTRAIASYITQSGSGQLPQYKAYAGVFLHELLHAVYGDHAWGNGYPTSITQVYNDPEYAAEATLDGQTQIAVQNNSVTQGVTVNIASGTENLPNIPVGSWVASSSATNLSGYQKFLDPSNGLQYYTIPINGAPTNVCIVDPATYQYVWADHFFYFKYTKGARLQTQS